MAGASRGQGDQPDEAPARAFGRFGTFAADFVRGAPGLGGRAVVFTLLAALTEGFGLLLLLPLVNVLAGTSLGGGLIDRVAADLVAFLPGSTPTTRLAVLLAAFAGLMVLRAWSILNRDVLLARLQTGFVERLRIRIVERLARAEWRVLAGLRHGRISHVLSNDIRSCGLAAQLALQAGVGGVLLAVQMILALLLSPAVALLVVVLLALGALLLRPALRRSRQLGTELTESNFRLTDDTNQFLGGLKLAFSQNLQGGFAREFRETLSYSALREIAFARQRSVGQIALTSLAAAVAGLALLLGFGVFDTSPPALIALLIVLARMSGPAAQIQQNLQYVAHSLPAYDEIVRLDADLATAVAGDPAQPQAAEAPPPGGTIALSDVAFAHGGADAPGVSGIDLVLRPGEFVGITGHSGAGKTTLIDLLVGLLTPERGTVSVGGEALRGAALAAWRDRISYVSQDPYLFHDSIAGNLRWARPDASAADMQDALALAGADALVAALPQGIDTVVGERGSRLSGGERQRIALARALIRRPELLILDEATNAIDVAGERAILDRLAALSPRPTVLMVAHREQSLARCERLIRLEGGRIAPPD